MLYKRLHLLIITLLVLAILSAQCSPVSPQLGAGFQTLIHPSQPEADPITLRINLESEPPTLDPGLALDTISVNVIGNLFMGLTAFHPETGEIIPALATDWTVSDNGLLWTFYLRRDIPWVIYDPLANQTRPVLTDDGKPRLVTAHDVEYAVKRNLNPATASNYAYVLYNLKNAAEVNAGIDKAGNPTSLGLDDIGVQALNDWTVQFTLEQPAGYFPAIAGLWVTKPLPAWTIEKWGEKWTEAGLIVSNGPYTLAEWLHGNKITLLKNPLWPLADTVQIDRVEALMIVEPTTAFAMYENNQLDTAKVSPKDIERIKSDPVLSAELRIAPSLCTYYYGFTHTKPPFDDVRVRRAFSAAIDRQTLVEHVTRGEQIPATSFAPPGIAGAPPPGTVGQGYDPALAKASFKDYLSEKEMTLAEFNDTYRISLGHNTSEGHAKIAAAIQQMWRETLGVSVKIESQEWQVYLQTLQKETPVEDAFHIWRSGWCADYPDENNWMHEVFNSHYGLNHLRRQCADPNCQSLLPPDRFDELTQTAAALTNPAERARLYHQAEDLLAGELAAYAPIYHYTEITVTKPWLGRNFPTLGGEDYYNWRIDSARQSAASP